MRMRAREQAKKKEAGEIPYPALMMAPTIVEFLQVVVLKSHGRSVIGLSDAAAAAEAGGGALPQKSQQLMSSSAISSAPFSKSAIQHH